MNNYRFLKKAIAFVAATVFLCAASVVAAVFFTSEGAVAAPASERSDGVLFADSGHAGHDGWTELTADGGELASGNYYLTADVNLTSDLTIAAGAEVTICLNGYKLAGTGTGSVITVNGVSLTLTDCAGESADPGHSHEYYVDATTDLFVFDNGQDGWAEAYESAESKGSVVGGVITGGKIDGCGGGISLQSAADVVVQNITIAGNTAIKGVSSSAYGGAIYVADGNVGTLTVSDCVISNNYAYGIGGGIYTGAYDVLIEGTAITGNTSGNSSAAIFSGNSEVLNITSGVIKDNVVDETSMTRFGIMSRNVEISGGEICDSISAVGDVVVSGGYIADGVIAEDYESVSVTGGFFASEPAAELLGQGYYVRQIDSSYEGYLEGYPYAVKQILTLNITVNDPIVYDAAEVEEGTDFVIEQMPDGAMAEYSCKKDGEADFTPGLPMNAGSYTVVAEVDDGTDRYYGEFALTIAKAIPEYEVPVINDGENKNYLSEITLPDGWAWKTPNTVIIKDSTNYYDAYFTPDDTDNYEIVEEKIFVDSIAANVYDHHYKWKVITESGGIIGQSRTETLYYLQSDVTLLENLTVAENAEVVICLNGYKLAGNGTGSVITVPNSSWLTICDCKSESTDAEHVHKYYKQYPSAYVFDNGQDGWQEAYDAAEQKGEIVGGVITGGKATLGGAINCQGYLIIQGGTIAGNYADEGGGIYYYHKAITTFESVSIRDAAILGNVATEKGGGISVLGYNMQIDGVVIKDNSAYSGGAISFIENSGYGWSIVFWDGEIYDNLSTDRSDIVLTDYMSFDMRGGTLKGYSQTGVISGTTSSYLKISGGYLNIGIENAECIVTGGFFADCPDERIITDGYRAVVVDENYAGYKEGFDYVVLQVLDEKEFSISAMKKLIYDGEPIEVGVDFSISGLPDGAQVTFYFDGNPGLPTDAGEYLISIEYFDVVTQTLYVGKTILTIGKVEPDFTVPEGITAYEGSTLGMVQLPENWQWADPSETVTADKTVYTANYISDDPNYYDVYDVRVTVEVIGEASKDDHHTNWLKLPEDGVLKYIAGSDGKSYYYLDEDLRLTAPVTIENADVVICLNGHKLIAPENSSAIIIKDSTVEICDCNDSTEHKYYVDEDGLYVFDNGQEGWLETYGAAETTGVINGGLITGCAGSESGAIKVGEGVNLLIDGVALAGNRAQNGAGLNVNAYEYETEITVRNVVIAGNVAEIDGGGIYLYYAAMIFESGIVENNKAKCNGGGLAIQNSEIQFCGAVRNNSAINGGGFVIYYSDVDILEGSEIVGNVAENEGGGIYSYGTTMAISDIGICGNKAERGGGIYVDDVNLILRDVEICDNEAVSGGAIYASQYDVKYCRMYIKNCTISGNVADENGSALYGENFALTLSGVTLRSDCEGVVVYLDRSQVTVADGEFCGNGTDAVFEIVNGTVMTVTGGRIGARAFAIDNGSLLLKGGFYAENISEYLDEGYFESGFGVVASGDATYPYVVASEASHSCANGVFGEKLTKRSKELSSGRYYLDEDLILESGLIIKGAVEICLNGHMLSTKADEPMIYIMYEASLGASLRICDCDESAEHPYYVNEDGLYVFDLGQQDWAVEYEKAEEKGVIFGGVLTGAQNEVIEAQGCMSLEIEGIAIVGNNCSSDDGVVVGFASNMVIKDTLFAGNVFRNGYGGILGANFNCVLSVYDSIIRDNVSVDGLTVVVYESMFEMTGCTITGNTNESYGGGLYIEDSVANIEDCVISENRTVCGGGVYIKNIYTARPDEVTFKGCRIESNSAEEAGAIYIDQSDNLTVVIEDCRIQSNTADAYGGIFSMVDLTVNGGKIAGNKGSNGTQIYSSGGKVLLNDVEIDGRQGNKNDADTAVTVLGDVEIRGGSIVNDYKAAISIAGKAAFYGCRITAEYNTSESDIILECYNEENVVEFYDGYFGSVEYYDDTDDDTVRIFVYGGYFSKQLDAEYVAEGYSQFRINSTFGDEKYVAGFPYTVYGTGEDLVVSVVEETPVYAGSSPEAGKNFVVDGVPEGAVVRYSYKTSGGSYVEGLPLEEGEYTVRAVVLDNGKCSVTTFTLKVLPDPESGNGKAITTGEIVGIAVGCTAGALLIVYLLFAVLYKKKIVGGAFFAKIYPFIK